jgi:hypothetical protein
MSKDDVYFAVSSILALLGLLGIDWKSICGKVAMPRSRAKSMLFLATVLGSLAMSGIGWYHSEHIDRRRWRSLDLETIYGHNLR